jgi:microsomal prostaglandin-E synthase 2
MGAGMAGFADEERRWREWVDQRLVRVITVNIYRSGKESFQTFDYIVKEVTSHALHN